MTAATLLIARNASAAPKCDTASRPIGVSATTLNFGVYSPGSGSPTYSNSLIQVYCTNHTNVLPSFTVALSAGSALGFNPRQMLNGSNILKYNMFIDAGYSMIWGDGTSGTSTQSYSVNQGQSQVSFTDYGELFPSQFVTAGAYGDSIVVTVAF